MSRERAAVRTYGALTRLYPRAFRDEYRADVVSLFREQCRDESTMRVFARSALDLAITIPSEHLEARMRRSPSPIVPLIYLAVALGGLGFAIIGGTEPSTLIIGLGLGLVGGVVAAVAWRRSTPVRESTLSGNWWKFLTAGPCLIALVLVVAAAGVEAWYLGMATVVVAFGLTAVGLVLGLMHLFSRGTRRIAA